MSIKVKVGGVYQDVVAIRAKQGGVYTAVDGVFVKEAGAYARVDAATPEYSFYWTMEGSSADYSTGSTPITLSSSSLSAAQAQAGSQSLACSGGFSLAEANPDRATNLQTNQDFIFSEGTAEFYWRWTGTWPSSGSAQICSFKNELYPDNIYLICRATSGQVRLQSTNSASGANQTGSFSGLVADTWHRMVIKWRRSGAPYLYFNANGGTAVTLGTDYGAMTNYPAAILIGNDTSSGYQFYIDNFKVWKTWRDDVL